MLVWQTIGVLSYLLWSCYKDRYFAFEMLRVGNPVDEAVMGGGDARNPGRCTPG